MDSLSCLFVAGIAQSSMPHCSPPTAVLPSFSACYWVLNSTLSYTCACIYAPFPANLFTLKMEAARSSKMLLSYHNTMQHHNPEDWLAIKLNLASSF